MWSEWDRAVASRGVFMNEPKNSDVYLLAVRTQSHQDVPWLDVAMNHTLRVYVFHSQVKLIHDHESGFEGKAASTKFEKVLKTGSRQFECHDFEVIMPAKPVDCRKPNCALEDAMFVRLLFQKGRLGRLVF